MTQAGSVLTRLAADAQALCRRTWWVFLVGGVAAVIFGVLAFVNPGAALFVLAMFFAAFVLVDGVFNLVAAVKHRGTDGWWIMLLMGILGLAVGGFALLNPPVGIMAFVLLVAFQAILLGVFTVMLGYRVRKATSREWILYLTGALSILFGIVVIARPAAGGLSIVYVIGAWAIVIGVLKVIFAFKAKNLPERVQDRLAGLR